MAVDTSKTVDAIATKRTFEIHANFAIVFASILEFAFVDIFANFDAVAFESVFASARVVKESVVTNGS